jgi:hypothetical protein
VDFVSAIKAVRPTGIIGVSTIPKSFNKEVQPSLRHAIPHRMHVCLTGPPNPIDSSSNVKPTGFLSFLSVTSRCWRP